ncbi:MAG TPA: hypothetical protein VGC16_04505 [Rhizomicrobium sp.]
MTKYAALGNFLKNQTTEAVPMTFQQIEKVTGFALPSSKQYPAWWSNNTSNNVMTKVWLDAGFRTEQVDIGGERLVFRRVRPAVTPVSAAPARGLSEWSRDFRSNQDQRGSSLFGALKGTFTIESGWDLTKPALEEEALDVEKTADLIDAGMPAK